MVEKSLDINEVEEIRLAVIGNVDSGKSTLVGVLSKCTLDDGNGSLRKLVFNFSHEKENGRTSSVTHEIMGFYKGKQVEPDRVTEKKATTWINVTSKSDKIISLIDLCGHEMYLKTTIFGLTGLVPDYGLVVVGANMGVQRMTKEHFGITLIMKIPIMVVMTKIDVAPDDIRKTTFENIKKILNQSGSKQVPILIKEEDDLVEYSKDFLNGLICPIFMVSSTTGEMIEKLRSFISNLKSRSVITRKMINPPKDDNDNGSKVEYLIDSLFTVKGIGLVTSGVLISGKVVNGQQLLLGPNVKGEYKQVIVKSIHFKRVNVEEIESGNSCCFHIKSIDSKLPIKKEHIRKGMVLLEKNSDQKCYKEFDAMVKILHTPALIKVKYQSVIHIGVVRQTAQIVEIKEKDLLKTGDSALVKFRFICSPEYIHEGAEFLFREGRTSGMGQIVKLYPFSNKEVKVKTKGTENVKGKDVDDKENPKKTREYKNYNKDKDTDSSEITIKKFKEMTINDKDKENQEK